MFIDCSFARKQNVNSLTNWLKTSFKSWSFSHVHKIDLGILGLAIWHSDEPTKRRRYNHDWVERQCVRGDTQFWVCFYVHQKNIKMAVGEITESRFGLENRVILNWQKSCVCVWKSEKEWIWHLKNGKCVLISRFIQIFGICVSFFYSPLRFDASFFKTRNSFLLPTQLSVMTKRFVRCMPTIFTHY